VNGWQPESAGSAPVTSVNTQTGAVVLDADDLDDSTTTNKFTTQSEIDKLAGIEAGAEVNTVDSVNSQTGVVVLDADDIDDTSTTNKFTTQTDIDKLAGIEAGAEVNTVDSVNGETGTVVLDADDIDDTSTTNKFTNQTDIDKLAGIEALADVTDATNVAAAGALMDGVAELADLADVASTAPSDGQVLTYDTVNGWQPETPSGGGTIDGSGTANKIAKWSDSDTLTDSVIYDDGTNVGIGTSSPSHLLDLQSTAPVLRIRNTTAPTTGGTSSLLFEGINDFSGVSQAFINSIQAGNSGVTRLVFGTSGSTDATATERMRIESSGNVGIGTSSPAVELDVDGEIRASDGILFGTDTAAANALDDYEEATWTPNDQSGASLTFTSVSGHYTKIGNLVTATFSVTYPSTASGVGARISLPFTSVLGDGNTGFHPTFTNANLTFTGITVSTFIQLYTYSGAIVGNSDLSGDVVRGTITYYV
jgi:hypothetical protein